MHDTIRDCDIFWTESGDPSHPPLLLVHGLPFHRGIWSEVVPRLQRQFRTISVDLPGFGESAVSPLAPSMDAYADILADLIARLAAGPALAAGHSMGGYALLNLASRMPERLAGLVMVCSRATADAPDQAANRMAMATRLRSESPEFVAEAMLPKMPRRGAATPGLLSRIRAAMDPLRADGIAWCQRAIAGRPDFSARLGSIPVPALVLAGSHDQVVPLEESGIMAANFRQGRLAVVEDAGHCPMLEKPPETADAILSWARELRLA